MSVCVCIDSALDGQHRRRAATAAGSWRRRPGRRSADGRGSRSGWLGSVYDDQRPGPTACPTAPASMRAPRPAGTTMTASRSPSRMLARALCLDRPSVELDQDRRLGEAGRAAAPTAGVPSWSTQPTAKWSVPPPEKIVPNRTTKMTGNASVQNSAARSRTKLWMLATVRATRRAHRRLSVPQRPAGQLEEHVLERRPADRQVRRLRRRSSSASCQQRRRSSPARRVV